MHTDREIVVRKSTLAEQGTEKDLDALTPGQRMDMIHQLTIDAWAMKGIDISNQRMRRDVERVIRRKLHD